jgi:N utilization substance protein A
MSEEEIKEETKAETAATAAETPAPEAVAEAPKPKKRGRKAKVSDEGPKITGDVDYGAFSLAASEIEKDSMVKAGDVAGILISTMEQAYLEWSYPGLFKDKDSEDPTKDLVKAHVIFSDDFKSFRIFDVKTVMNDDDIVDDSYQVSVEDAKAVNPDAKIGDTVELPFDVTKLDKSYVRRVKQLFQSHLKDASRQAILSVYSNQIGGLIEGTVTKADVEANSYELTFGKAEGYLRKNNLIPSDHFAVGDRVTVYLSDVSDKMNPPSLVISRSSEKFVLKLMEKAVPEVQSGDVKIKAIAREPGKRTKVFVDSANPNLDPVGACLGPESSRIRTVLSELHGEKIDVLRFYPNKALQIVEAMKPATVIGVACPDDFFDANVHYDELETEPDYEFPKITAVVMNGNQGVAIGTVGVNVRLASRITMCTISVLQADDAIKQGLKYMMTTEIQKAVAALAAAAAPAVPETPEATEEVPAAPAPEAVPAEATPVAPTETAPVSAPAPVAPAPAAAAPAAQPAAAPAAVSAAPAAEKKPEETVEHVEIRNKPKISLDELEKALSQKKGPAETHSYKKRWDHHDHEDANAKKDEGPSKAATANAMPIYTEEELKAMEADQSKENENPEFEGDDIDLDQYDSDKYYDDGNTGK